MNKCIAITALVIGLALPAQAETLNLRQTIEAVLANHPQLNINEVDAAIARTETQRLDGMLDPVVSASVSASQEKTPTSSAFQASETRTGQLFGGVSKPLSSGGTLGANFAYNRTSQAYNSPLAAQLASINPAYRSQINLSYRHPLLKGFGRPAYNQGIIAAEAGIAQAEQQRLLIMHNLSLQSLNAFFQLAGDEINIHIAEQAVQRSKKLLAYQRQRESFGLIERADRLQAEALLAARKTDLERARARRQTSQSSLNRLMLRNADSDISVALGEAEAGDVPSVDTALLQANALRPEFKLLKLQMDAADAQLAIARDSDQPQLDVVAEVGTRALDGTAGTAAARSFTVNDHYAGLSLELSDMIGRNSANAGMRRAELQRQRIQAERISTMEQVRSDIAAALTALRSGQPTLAAADQQVKAEQSKFNAEMRRYREGRSSTATLVQFEGELRNASLNAELQRLTLALADKQLAWAQGIMLYELGIIETPASANEPEQREP